MRKYLIVMKRLGLTMAVFVSLGLGTTVLAKDAPRSLNQKWPETTNLSSERTRAAQYFWSATQVNDDAQLLTLFCSNCFGNEAAEVPVVSVLRDTIGDTLPENDRISYVWLLSVPHLGTGQRILSAVPFFYWRVGRGSDSLSNGDLKPQLNLTSPQDPMMSGFTRQLVQWTAFDPLAVWVRAPSRSYQSNGSENARFHLEETISYLRNAPVGNDSDSLTDSQLKTLIARLELRKSLLGGLVDTRHAERFGDEANFERERVRSRNWELLRQCAEKTGLYFEPVDLGGVSGQYGILWYPANSKQPVTGTAIKPIWKLLNIQDPWQDVRLQNWDGLSFQRYLDDAGRLVPEGSTGSKTVSMIPLAFYSLTYPKIPLLLADFRDRLHIRRQEMTQRSINQITSGVIGVSRLTNWYYFACAMAYNFISSRHGAAVSQAQRLDSYSQFRVHLAGDDTLDRRLYRELDQRANSLTVSPLDSTGENAAKLARARYSMLLAQTQGPSALTERLAKDRRAELAQFGQSTKSGVTHAAIHLASVGLYTQRVSKAQLNLAELDRERRFTYALNYLGDAVKNGTQPEVAYNTSNLAASVSTLNQLSSGISSPALRGRAIATLHKVADLTKDETIMADCRQALVSIRMGPLAPSQLQRPTLAETQPAEGGTETIELCGTIATAGGSVRGLK